ncbi:MAG: metallophosphoesterase [Nanoarchaeota archaeon]|nr:metallophosphoesterase [Nanoarchaeota archaeon]
MKILAAGDFHGDSTLAFKLADKAEKENVELVILCGDLIEMNQNTENIIKPFTDKNQKVLIIPGNHETIAMTDFLADFYGVKNIHGYSVRYKDVGIFGAGGANVGLHQWGEDEIFNLLKGSSEKIDYLKKKIMVTHVPPSKTNIEKFSKFVDGSDGIRKAVLELQPDILLCSHIHEAEGIEEKIGKTNVISVGRQGKIIDL